MVAASSGELLANLRHSSVPDRSGTFAEMLRRRLLPTVAGVLVLLSVVPVLRAQEDAEWRPEAGLALTEPKQVHSATAC